MDFAVRWCMGAEEAMNFGGTVFYLKTCFAYFLGINIIAELIKKPLEFISVFGYEKVCVLISSHHFLSNKHIFFASLCTLFSGESQS